MQVILNWYLCRCFWMVVDFLFLCVASRFLAIHFADIFAMERQNCTPEIFFFSAVKNGAKNVVSLSQGEVDSFQRFS